MVYIDETTRTGRGEIWQHRGLVSSGHAAGPDDGERIDGPIVFKAGIGAVCFAAIVAVFVFLALKIEGMSWAVALSIVSCGAVVGGGVGAMLGIKDNVQSKMFAGQHVGLIPRVLFGSGGLSVGVWIAMTIFCTMVVLPIGLAFALT